MIGLPLFFALMAYLNYVGPVIPRRGYEVANCVIFALVTGWLSWISGLNLYQITDAGLVVSRLWGRRLIPWERIDQMVWNRVLSLVFIKGNGRTMAIVSIQMFGDQMEMVAEISRRSRCKLSSILAEELKS